MLILNPKPPKRVLHVIRRMRPAGAQTLLMNIYRHIDRTQIQFDFALGTRQPDYYDEEIKALGGRLFRLPWSVGNPFSVIAYVRSLEAVLRNRGPFIAIHSHGIHSGHFLPVGKKVSIPLRLAHSHSSALDKSSIIRRLWGEMMRRRIKASATHLLACSALAAEWLYGAQWHQDSRSLLLPNAIDLTRYEELRSDVRSWRKKTGLPLNDLLIGHIGRFDPVKNHTFLLDIFLALRNICPQAKLILVGEGDLRPQVQRQVAEKGIEEAVYFLGARSDIPQILGSLDLFVLPSLHEGLGIVLIEAQAAGVPCLVSDVVPSEVDLGLGIVQFKSLSAGAHEWAQELLNLKAKSVPTWEKRKAALQHAGHDIQSTVELLQNLYLSTD